MDPEVVGAVLKGDVKKMQSLLLQGRVDVHERNEESFTYLHQASRQPEITRLLLQAGADINCVAGDFTPLVIAVMSRSLPVVKELLEAGAEVLPKVKHGPNALSISCALGLSGIAKVLLESLPSLAERSGGSASSKKKRRFTTSIVDAQNQAGRTPLMLAVQTGHADIINMLLEFGVDVSVKGPDGGTVLHTACFGGQVEAITALLAVPGIDVKGLTNNDNATALFIACEQGHSKVVTALLSSSAAAKETASYFTLYASLPHRDPVPFTPLMLASYNADMPVLHALIAGGVDVDVCSDTACALSCASVQNHSHVVTLLLKAGASPNLRVCGMEGYALQVACWGKCMQSIHALVAGGAHVNARSRTEETPLLVLCGYGEGDEYLSVVETLISLGAGVDAVNARGNTPLMAASEGGRSGIVRLLLAAGADAEVKDRHGRSALQFALKSHHTQVANLLVEKMRGGGADDTRGSGSAAAAGAGGGANLGLSPLSLSDDNEANLVRLRKVKECMNCGKKGEQIRMCSGCKRVALCSAECLKAVWPTHKAACKRWSQQNKQKKESKDGEEDLKGKEGKDEGGREGGKSGEDGKPAGEKGPC